LGQRLPQLLQARIVFAFNDADGHRSGPSVLGQKFVEKQPQILRLRLPQKSAAISAQDDKSIIQSTSDSAR
jgi:hypothetical protein